MYTNINQIPILEKSEVINEQFPKEAACFFDIHAVPFEDRANLRRVAGALPEQQSGPTVYGWCVVRVLEKEANNL